MRSIFERKSSNIPSMIKDGKFSGYVFINYRHEFRTGWDDVSIITILFAQYAISQLQIVRSGLHLVTYLDVGNF